MSLAQVNRTLNVALAPLGGGMANAVAMVLALMYANRVAPALPMIIEDALRMPVVKVLVIAVLFWMQTQNPVNSLVAAVVLVMVMNLLSGRNLLEAFRIDQNTNVHPNCLGLTKQDLVNAFEGDEDALRLALYNINAMPHHPLNDEFAPLLGTYLINKGYELGQCKLPSDEQSYFQPISPVVDAREVNMNGEVMNGNGNGNGMEMNGMMM